MEGFYELLSLVNIDRFNLKFDEGCPLYDAYSVHRTRSFSMEPNTPIHSSRAQYFRSNFLFCASSQLDEPMLVLTM